MQGSGERTGRRRPVCARVLQPQLWPSRPDGPHLSQPVGLDSNYVKGKTDPTFTETMKVVSHAWLGPTPSPNSRGSWASAPQPINHYGTGQARNASISSRMLSNPRPFSLLLHMSFCL